MTDKLTPTQTLLMWGLLAKQGIAKQADIMPAPKAADRKALEAAKLVSTSKVSRSLWLKLDDKGWGWASDHLRDSLPPAQGALHDMMIRLHDHLAKSDASLADFIGEAPPAKTKPKKTRSKAVTWKSIEAAYVKASGGQTSVRVLLADLRLNLPSVSRADLDEALCRAHLEGKLILMRLDNPVQITEAVKAARIDFKGVPMDLVWIEK